MSLFLAVLVAEVVHLTCVGSAALPRVRTIVNSPSPAPTPKAQLLGLVDGVGVGVDGRGPAAADIFVCPQTLKPLKHVYRCYGLFEDEYFVNVKDSSVRYRVLPNAYTDLTIRSEVERPVWTLSTRERIGQNFFQTRLIPTLYERGYRQNFQLAGFPGPDLEFKEADEFFGTLAAGGTVVDLSCGSGFMTRKFMTSNRYARVIGADLSPTMLEESRRRFEEEGLPVPELVRCDSARLPFATGSIDCLHAGAAMHCWPKLEEALAEIHRVLKPGGRFFATTFFVTNPLDRLTQRQGGSSGFYMFRDEEEIEGFVSKGGFGVDGGAVTVRKEGRGCAIVKATKAAVAAAGDDSGSDSSNESSSGSDSSSDVVSPPPYTVM
jgi:SAM-dependent methyltransferase